MTEVAESPVVVVETKGSTNRPMLPRFVTSSPTWARETAVPERVTQPMIVSVWNGSGPGQTDAPAAAGAPAAGAVVPTASGASVTEIDCMLVPDGVAARSPARTFEK